MRALPAVILVALVLVASPALAQAAGEETDPDTMSACEADNDRKALELVCPITVALHLRSLSEDYAEWGVWGYIALLGIAVITWIAILLYRAMPRRFLKMVAKDTIAEVSAGNPATYLVQVENRRARRPVEVELAVSRPPKGWSASLSIEKPLPSGFKELIGSEESMRVPLSARKMGANVAIVKVTVTSPDSANPDEWAELDVTAIPYIQDEPRVRKGKDARVVTLIKTRASHPAIQSVVHEPAAFRLHDQVTTTVIVANRGDAGVQELPVALFVNDAEVAREVVSIPPRGEACIEFPWNADAAENRVRIAIGA